MRKIFLLAVCTLLILPSQWNSSSALANDSCLSLNTTQYLEASSRLIPLDSNFTVEFDFYLSKDNKSYAEVISQGGQPNSFYIGINPDLGIRAGDTWADTGAKMPLKKWVHIALTRTSGSVGTFYIDGKVFATINNYVLNNVGTATRLGAQYNVGASERITGCIDNLMIWKSVRTPNEVIQDSLVKSPITNANLIAFYGFDSVSSTGLIENNAVPSNSLRPLNTPELFPVTDPSTKIILQEVFDPNSFAPVTAQADIKSSDYPYVAALARASILANQPVAPTTQKITYHFESGVPIENQNMIKEGGDNFLSHFGNILNYSSKAINIIVYKTKAGALELGKVFDPLDSTFLEDLARSVAEYADPTDAGSMGGFSMGDNRVVVIMAPYFKTSDPNIPTVPFDPVVISHELAHEVQASINKGTNMRNPVWLCEGGAQVMGSTMSVYKGKDYWATAGRDQWSGGRRIPANRTIADLKIMEGEDPKKSEYTTGAALSEYLIAWGGFSNSLLVNQISYKTQNPDTMSGFRQAFKIVYGQSLDDFYIHALPYINYVSANGKTSYASSSEALAFITNRLGAVKAAEVVAAAAELKAKQDAAAKAADAKAAADKAAADKAAADKAAAVKKLTITCVKGKLTKKVTAVKPVCPSGFKKK